MQTGKGDNLQEATNECLRCSTNEEKQEEGENRKEEKRTEQNRTEFIFHFSLIKAYFLRNVGN